MVIIEKRELNRTVRNRLIFLDLECHGPTINTRPRKYEINFKRFLAESKETDFTNIVFCLTSIQKTTN